MLDGALTPDDPVMLIKVGKTAALANTPDEFYESARKWWIASPVQAGKAHRILALDGNTVVDVYEPRRWEVSDAPDTEGKVAFHGVPARDRETFVGLSMDHLFPKGAANPVRYTTVAALTPTGTPEAPGPASVEQEEVIHRQDGLYLLLLRINQSWHDGIPAEELYNATRGYWKVSATRVEQVSRVFAVADGVVREVYEPLTWEPSPFPGEEHRNGFQGVVASDRDRWVGRDVSSVFPLGSQNPVTYVDAEDLATALSPPAETIQEERPPVRGQEPDLAEQVAPLLRALDGDLLWAMSRGAQELFHTNTLGWLMEHHPRAMAPVRRAFGDTSPDGPVETWREHRHLDLIVRNADDTARYVVENKLYSIPNSGQLERYARVGLPWSDKHGPCGAERTSYFLLSLMEPNFQLPQPWSRVSYEELHAALTAVPTETLGPDAELFDRYLVLVHRLVGLKADVDPRNDLDGPFSVRKTLEALDMKWFSGPLQRMRFTGLAQSIAEVYGAPVPLEVNLTRGLGLLSYRRDLSNTRSIGWQLQEGQLRLYVLIRDEGLTGKGDRLAAARAKVAQAEYADFVDFSTPELVLGPRLTPMKLDEGEWRRFAPDFVYRYRKVSEDATTRQLADTLAELTAHVDHWNPPS